MAGYKNFSMSNNAVRAYENGEKPLSKWTKSDIFSEINRQATNGEVEIEFDMKLARKIPISELKKMFLSRSSWHHTSSRYNKTDFYSVDTNKIAALTNEKINFVLKAAPINKAKKVKKEDIPLKAECSFLEWSGSRKYPKATEITEVGEIKGNWFFRADGTKKSVHADGFKILKKFVPDEKTPDEKNFSEQRYSMKEIVEKHNLPVEYKTPKDGREIAVVAFSGTDKRAYQMESFNTPRYRESDLPLKKAVEDNQKPSAINEISKIKAEQKIKNVENSTLQKAKLNQNEIE